MKIAFCGFGRAGLEILIQLLTRSELKSSDVMVFTHKGEANSTFLEFLQAANITYTTNNINKQINTLTKFQPQYLISAYYRAIIDNKILELVDMRAMNMHPSLLPDYKGCFSGCWAILNGENESGITFHYMTDKVDAGNILYQERIKIHPDTTAYELYHRKISAFISAFHTAADALFSGEPGISQPKDEGRYYPRTVPYNGQIDSENVDLDFARRFVRAMYFPPFQPARINYQNSTCTVSSVAELEQYIHWFRH